jgi:DNA repair ATPase RecN
MESIYNKEKKLETVLEKLTNLSRSSKSYAGNIDDLYLEKNQLQSEKNEIESKYKQLLLEYNNLKQKLKILETNIQKKSNCKNSLVKISTNWVKKQSL